MLCNWLSRIFKTHLDQTVLKCKMIILFQLETTAMRLVIIICLVVPICLINGVTRNNVKASQVECSFSKNYITNGSCHLKPVDRQNTAFNLNLFILKPLKDIVVNVNFFRRYNTFVPFPIKYEFKMCEIVSKSPNSIILSYVKTFLTTYTNINHSCPLVGEIYVKNALFRSEMVNSLTAMVPQGVYRVEANSFERNKNNFLMNFIGQFEITEKEIIN